MIEENEVEAVHAVKWKCEHCGHLQYSDGSLEETSIDYIRRDTLCCDSCGKNNIVVLLET